MRAFDDLCARGDMMWIAQEHGWAVAPEEIVTVLSGEGFQECKRELTTSRRDRQPAGGVWQGVNPRTGSVASAIWLARPPWPQTIVFIEIDGHSLQGSPETAGDPYRDDGGEA